MKAVQKLVIASILITIGIFVCAGFVIAQENVQTNAIQEIRAIDLAEFDMALLTSEVASIDERKKRMDELSPKFEQLVLDKGYQVNSERAQFVILLAARLKELIDKKTTEIEPVLFPDKISLAKLVENIEKTEAIKANVALSEASIASLKNIQAGRKTQLFKTLEAYRRDSLTISQKNDIAIQIIALRLEEAIDFFHAKAERQRLAKLNNVLAQAEEKLSSHQFTIVQDQALIAKSLSWLKKLNAEIPALTAEILNKTSLVASKGTENVPWQYKAQVLQSQVNLLNNKIQRYYYFLLVSLDHELLRVNRDKKQEAPLALEQLLGSQEKDEVYPIDSLDALRVEKKLLERSILDLESLQVNDTGLGEVSQTESHVGDTGLRMAKSNLIEIDRQLRKIDRLESVEKDLLLEQMGGFEKIWSSVVTFLQSIIHALKGISDYALFTVGDSPVTVGSIFYVILLIFVAQILSAVIKRLLNQIAIKNVRMSESAMFTIGRIIHYSLILIALIIAFESLGIDMSRLALVAGALSVGIGFGLQSIFNNFISGLILLFERPFRVGDLIELESGVVGRIRAINVRSTHINTRDNIDILVPNSEFVSGRVINYTFGSDLRQLRIPFGVAYGSDKEVVKKAVIEAALSLPQTVNNNEHPVDVWLINFGESSLDFELAVWIRGNKLVRHKNPIADYNWAIESALTKYGIEIPFPQRDLHLRSIDDKALLKTQVVESASLCSSSEDNTSQNQSEENL